MSGPLTLIFKVENAKNEFEGLFREANDYAKQNEPGTLTHRLFKQGDGTIRLYDDYESSEAMMEHVKNANESGIFPKLMAAGDITEVVVLGDPSAEAQGMLSDMGAAFASHEFGYSRLGRQEAAARA